MVHSKIVQIADDTSGQNTLSSAFVGDFLDLWTNFEQLEQIGNNATGGVAAPNQQLVDEDIFPMVQKPIGFIQITKYFADLLMQECMENEVFY